MSIFLLIIALVIALNLKNVAGPQKKRTSTKLVATDITLGIMMVALTVID